MNNFVVSIDGNLQVMALRDIPADTNFANIVGEVVGDADTDDPLVALRNPSSRVSLEGVPVRLSEMRGEA